MRKIFGQPSYFDVLAGETEEEDLPTEEAAEGSEVLLYSDVVGVSGGGSAPAVVSLAHDPTFARYAPRPHALRFACAPCAFS